FWENPVTGARLGWLMSANLLTHATVDLGLVPAAWSLVALADFDDDGQNDLFWQNPATGEVLVWLMNGTTYVGTVTPGSPPPPWRLRAVRPAGVPAPGVAPTIDGVVAAPGTTLIGSNGRLGAAQAGTARGLQIV